MFIFPAFSDFDDDCPLNEQRWQSSVSQRTGEAASCYKENAASPVLWLTAVLAGLHDKWLPFPESFGWSTSTPSGQELKFKTACSRKYYLIRFF